MKLVELSWNNSSEVLPEPHGLRAALITVSVKPSARHHLICCETTDTGIHRVLINARLCPIFCCYIHYAYLQRDCHAELTWVTWLHIDMVFRQPTVTHPSTNLSRRIHRLTSLIEISGLYNHTLSRAADSAYLHDVLEPDLQINRKYNGCNMRLSGKLCTGKYDAWSNRKKWINVTVCFPRPAGPRISV